MAYHRIEESKLTAIANSIRSQLGTTATMKPDEMPEMIGKVGIGFIPDYWKSYLESKATEINTAINGASANRSTFLWYTDAHWASNYGQSPMILKYLSKHTAMSKTFFGGDIALEKSGEIDAMTAWKELVKDIPNHRSVIGNHDNQVTELADASARADFFIQDFRTGDMSIGTNATNGKMYYFLDNYIENTRYICLSTGRMWTLSDEVEWCIEVLNSTPKGWHIVVISHLWLNYDYTNGIVIATPEDYTQGYLDMFDAYNYRESGTESFTGKVYDFTNAQGKIEFIMGGHVHIDYDFATETGIPVILTECDGWGERDASSSATKGTTTENCVYAVIADYSAKSVKIINVGRGDTRSLQIPDVVTYTNWAKKAIAKDGSIYNGKGYKENIRIDSSENEVSATGWVTTGFIPAKKNDIIRFKNCSVMDVDGANGSTSRCAFRFYDSNFSYNTVSGSFKPTNLPSSAWAPVYGADGDIVEIKVPSSYSASIAYVRITLDDINENSIITVNEEID